MDRETEETLRKRPRRRKRLPCPGAFRIITTSVQRGKRSVLHHHLPTERRHRFTGTSHVTTIVICNQFELIFRTPKRASL
jgi:hypothetical protein